MNEDLRYSTVQVNLREEKETRAVNALASEAWHVCACEGGECC